MNEKEKYHKLIEATGTGFVILDDKGLVLDANQTYVSLTGRQTFEEIRDHGVDEWTAPYEKERNLAAVKQCFEQGYIRHLEIDYIDPNGKITPVEIDATVAQTDTGVQILSLVHDISERKQIEKSLRLSEQRARAIVDSIPLGMHMYRLEPDGRLVFVGANVTADKLLGVDNSLFVGKTIEEAFPPLAETEAPTRYRAAAKGENWQTEQITYDEGKIQGAFEVYAFQTSPGNMVAAFLNVTARKQTEQALLESEMNFRGFAEASSYGFGMGQLTGQLVFANRALLNILDEEKPEDAYTKTFFDYYPPADQERLRDEILPVVLQKGQWVGEIPLLSSKGRLTPTEQNIFLIYNEQGQPRMVGNIITDITTRRQDAAERARLQQEVIQAQQHAIQELSTPIIPVMDRILVMPLIGSIDSLRARDITRTLLAGITQHRAKVVILDVTGVGIMDTGIVNHLNKTIQAARLKGAQTIVTGMSDAVAEAIVDLGIDWSGVVTLSDLQTGLITALDSLGVKLSRV